MGRGSKKKQGGAESSAVAAAPAATPPPAAADAIPDEPVWRLLLGELWQPPEQQLVCRLLCCSRAMARLVHERCGGRVVAIVRRQPQEENCTHRPDRRQVTAQGATYSTWLAKHARLLAVLELQLWDKQEQHVAVGLHAAAGVGAAQRMTRAQAASQSTATRAAAAAAAAGPAASVQPQPLPLRSLSLSTSASCLGSNASGMQLLPSLAAACPQLTRLQLEKGAVAEGQPQQLAAAFTGLGHLRELSLELLRPVAVPALQLGTQLTKLRLVYVELSAEAFSSLPASLVELEYRPYSAVPAAGHLTALTRLACWSLDAGSSVPPSVQHLQVTWCSKPSLLHAFTRLRSLDRGVTDISLEQLQAAVAAIGPSLTELSMQPEGALAPALLSQHVGGPNLPLTGLTVEFVESSVAHLGQWIGLTRLALSCVEPAETPPQVAHQLQQLTALRDLVLDDLGFSSVPQPSLQPLVDGVMGMSSLRSLEFKGGLDAQQRAELQGMTQLKRLVV